MSKDAEMSQIFWMQAAKKESVVLLEPTTCTTSMLSQKNLCYLCMVPKMPQVLNARTMLSILRCTMVSLKPGIEDTGVL